LLIAGWARDALVAKSLVEANLCATIRTAMRLPYYIDCVTKKEVVPGAKFEATKEPTRWSWSTAIGAFGQTHARKLMDSLIAKATKTGVGVY
jgi:LDH2 family malate/lactate/ureidoglycolate dehydrogenase